MSAFLSTLLYILSYNLRGLLFYGAALYFCRRGKSFKPWFFIGLALQGYSVLGTVMAMFMADSPMEWRTLNNYLSIAVFAIVTVAVLLLLQKWKKERSST